MKIAFEKHKKCSMKKLKNLDEVAYVRFASVYKNFTDVKSFIKEIEELNKKGD